MPKVDRGAETSRFRDYLASEQRELGLDPARPLSVDLCEELALRYSLDLRVRELALRMQDEQVKLALAGGLPKANLSYTETERSNRSLANFGGFSADMEDRHQQSLSVGVVAPVLDFGLTYYSYQIALDRRRQEQLLIARARQLLTRDVRIAYAEHAGAIRQEKLAKVAYQAAREVLRVAKNLEREQLAVKADTALVEAAVAQAGLVLSLATQRVEETHLVLSQLMSLPPGVAFAIVEDYPAMPPPPDSAMVAAYEDRALEARPELAVQDLERHISANAVRKEASAFFPKLDALGSFNWSSASMAVNKSFFLGGFTVAHSLLDGGATIFRYRLAQDVVDVEKERTLLVSMGVLYDVQLRALRVKQAYETINAAGALEKARRDALDRIVSLYKEGLEDEAGAARALADLTSQATVLDRAQTEYQTAWAELWAAVLPESLPPATQPATRPTTVGWAPPTAPASPVGWAPPTIGPGWWATTPTLRSGPIGVTQP